MLKMFLKFSPPPNKNCGVSGDGQATYNFFLREVCMLSESLKNLTENLSCEKKHFKWVFYTRVFWRVFDASKSVINGC